MISYYIINMVGDPTETAQTSSIPPPVVPARRLAAVMFADMVGYSRRVEQDEIRNAAQAAQSVGLFKELIGDYGGQVKNVAGDGVLALFDSAEQALRFAMQIQNEFRKQAVWGDGEPIQFRIGISLGEVIEDSSIVQGHCVNVAARLQQIAQPGNVIVTADVRNAVRDRSGLSIKTLGRPSLKNLSEPIEVFLVDRVTSDAARSRDLSDRAFTPEMPAQPSIAVLALSNLSGDPANDHLCEGIVEDIIANLSRFRGLMVIARHSAFLFNLKANGAGEISRRLGVRYLLGGSLRRSGKRMRIAVELIDASSEGVLWSDQFNIEVEELFDLQDEVTAAVASRLAVQIDFAERRQESQLPIDMRAYGLVIRGRHLVLQYAKEANAYARRLLEEAIGIAPEYGRAYGAMSRTHNLDWFYSWSTKPDDSLDRAVELARRAIDLDRLDARGFNELGFSYLFMKRHEESLAEYTRAVALNPNDADILAEYADSLAYAGQPGKSVELLEKAMRLNPYYPDWYLWNLADAYVTMGRPADVIATVRKMQNPDEGRRMLAASYAELGMMDEARAEAKEVLRLHPEFTIGRWRHRPPYRDATMLERYIEGLRKAGLPE
jgi:adenylate cyclase